MLYNKHFYGFEKEASSSVYRDNKSIFGHYFNYRYPIRQEFIPQTLKEMLNRPVWTVGTLFPKNKFELEEIEEQKLAEVKRIEALEPKERRRYEAEKKRKAKIEADLEPEKILREQIEITKRQIASVQTGGDLLFERMRGLVTFEDGDQT